MSMTVEDGQRSEIFALLITPMSKWRLIKVWAGPSEDRVPNFGQGTKPLDPRDFFRLQESHFVGTLASEFLKGRPHGDI